MKKVLSTLMMTFLLILGHSATAKTIKVGLYYWIPSVEQFKVAIQEAWNEQHADVSLDFVVFDEKNGSGWDGGYTSDPPDDLDVFVFDALFLHYFKEQGYLAPIEESEVKNLSDILPFAVEGSKMDGKLYGIPQFMNPHVLFYRKDDTALQQASSLDDLVKALGQCQYTAKKPPKDKGLMVAMYDWGMVALFYVEALEDIYGVYTTNPPLPFEIDQLNNWAITHLRKIVAMASTKNVKYYGGEPYNNYTQAKWFGKGYGRAAIDFIDSLSVMDNEARKNVAFKLVPFSNRGKVSLFWAGIIGINSKTESRGTKKLAIELANLMASTEVVVKSIGGVSHHGRLQYLMPARNSAFKRLQSMSSHYERMYQLVTNTNPKLFRLGQNAKKWLKQMKNTVIAPSVFAKPICSEDKP